MGLGVPSPVGCVWSSSAPPASVELQRRLQALPADLFNSLSKKIGMILGTGSSSPSFPHPKLQVDVEHIPHWIQAFCFVIIFLKNVYCICLFLLTSQSIYLKDGISFLLILSQSPFQIRQFPLISFCKNCSEVSFMLAHQKMRPVVLQNNTSKILLIFVFFRGMFHQGLSVKFSLQNFLWYIVL